jgi:ribosomal protein S27E
MSQSTETPRRGLADVERKTIPAVRSRGYTMHDVIRCPQCQKQLHVPEGCAGRRVKCPVCPSTFVAPAPGPAEPVEEAAILLEEAGEVDAPRKSRERDEDRRPRRKKRPPRRRSADDDDDEEDQDAFRYRRRLWPHRGGMVLALGILSLAVSFTVIGGLKFAIITLILAYMDLGAMDRGEMDPRGRGTTRAGQVCAIIGLCLSAAMLFLFCLLTIAMPHH